MKPKQEAWLKRAVGPVRPGKIDQLVIFGDSLSDTGRLRARTPLVYPSDVYWKSRPSQGPLWIDYVTSATSWKTSNYAVAGAATHSSSWLLSFFVASLDEQVSHFLEDHKRQDISRFLAVIWIGPNNYLNEPAQADVNRTMRELRKSIEALQKRGVQNFVIGTMPELAGLPVNRAAPRRDELLGRLTLAHNKALVNLLAILKRSYPTVTFTRFQAFEINQKTIVQPSAFGFANISDACYRGDIFGKFEGTSRFCRDPSGHKFWDGLHPNSKMHCYYAAQFLADLHEADLLATYQKDKAMNLCREL